MWEYRATPIEAHDGDTVRVLVDLGFYARIQVDIRLLGVAAPELGDPGGEEAHQYAQTWLDDHVHGRLWPLLVETTITHVAEPTEIRSFTRFVGTILDIKTGESLNADIAAFVAEFASGTGP